MSFSKRILLIITGGIAAFKAVDLVRLIVKSGGSVPIIMTDAAQEFVTPLTLSALSGEKVYTELFSLTDELEMGHIELSRDADLLVVVPATANTIAKMAHGHCDDLASTALLATDKPVLIAPAMNVRMWDHPATKRNIEILRNDGVVLVGPEDGQMACGEFGPGRLAEAEDIFAAIQGMFAPQEQLLSGKHILVTAGPTHEPIDPVRVIANRSSGKQGYAIAQAARSLGAEVTLVSGPVALEDPQGVNVVRVETARQMLAATQDALPADAGIFAAAVADWRVDNVATSKMKKAKGKAEPDLKFVENPDILATVSQMASGRPGLVVGFAAETDDVLENAMAKRKRKQCDWIVANDVSPETGIMGGDQNRVHIVKDDGVESWDKMSKQAVALKLVQKIAQAL